MKNYSLKETFFIAQDAVGEPLELPSSDVAMACLAFDIKSKQLVELHVLTHSDVWSQEEAETLFDRLVLLAGVNGGSVPRVLRRGKLDGLVFFTLALEEGETISDYTARSGSIAELATLSLLDGLITKLYRLQKIPRLFRACSLRNARLIYSPQGPHYQRVIQIQQLGLHTLEGRSDDLTAEARLAAELGQMLYLMLTGHPSPMRGGPLVESVRLLDRCHLLREFVINSFTKGATPQTLADAASAVQSARQFATESGTASLGMAPFSSPWLAQIFGSDQLDFLYPVQFELSSKAAAKVDEISCRPARDSRSRQQVFLLPLPGKRVLPRAHFSSTPEGLAQIPQDQVEHLLLPHSTWNSEHFCFHIENTRNSFTLREFIQQRGSLQPNEIIAILSQIECAQKEALQLGLQIPSLKSSAVRCVFRDDCDEATLTARCQMTISHWPGHLVKLRLHATLSSVTNPWPSGINPDRPEATRFNDALVLIAVEMAGGLALLDQPGHLPDDFVQFLQQQVAAAAGMDPVLEPSDFIRSLREHAAGNAFPLPERNAETAPVNIPAPIAACEAIAIENPQSPENELITPRFDTVDSIQTIEETPAETVAVEQMIPASIEDQPAFIPELIPTDSEIGPDKPLEEVLTGPVPNDPECTEDQSLAVAPLLEAPAMDVAPDAVVDAAETNIAPTSEATDMLEAKAPVVQNPAPLLLTTPKAIATYFSDPMKTLPPPVSVAIESLEPAESLEPTPPAPPTFQPFQERAGAQAPETPAATIPEQDLPIAPFPTEELESPTEPTLSAEPAPAAPTPFQPKSFPPSTSGLVTWRFESSPRPASPPVSTPASPPAAPKQILPPPPAVEIATPAFSALPTTPAPETEIAPASAQAASEPTQVESAPSAEDLLDDLPPEEFGAPTLNIDLARLTTSDSLFSRRPRTITIRNR